MIRIALANISKLAEGKLSLSTDLGSEPTPPTPPVPPTPPTPPVPPTPPTPTYKYIISAGKGSYGGSYNNTENMYILGYDGDSNLRAYENTTARQNDPNFQWVVEESGTGYTFYNVGAEMYLTYQDTYGQELPWSADSMVFDVRSATTDNYPKFFIQGGVYSNSPVALALNGHEGVPSSLPSSPKGWGTYDEMERYGMNKWYITTTPSPATAMSGDNDEEAD